jgi:hypothetical protein
MAGLPGGIAVGYNEVVVERMTPGERAMTFPFPADLQNFAFGVGA